MFGRKIHSSTIWKDNIIDPEKLDCLCLRKSLKVQPTAYFENSTDNDSIKDSANTYHIPHCLHSSSSIKVRKLQCKVQCNTVNTRI